MSLKERDLQRIGRVSFPLIICKLPAACVHAWLHTVLGRQAASHSSIPPMGSSSDRRTVLGILVVGQSVPYPQGLGLQVQWWSQSPTWYTNPGSLSNKGRDARCGHLWETLGSSKIATSSPPCLTQRECPARGNAQGRRAPDHQGCWC